MKMSERLFRERAFVEYTLGGMVICRCGATLATFAEKCSADLAEWCQGFDSIERAKQKFNREQENVAK